MSRRFGNWILAAHVGFAAAGAAAATYYVATNGAHAPPFTNWAMAATNVQAAIDAASSGDTVLVSDGTYRSAAQIAITNPGSLDLRSVNGAEATVIDGMQLHRCLYVSYVTSTVAGFTLTGGYSDQGAGVWASGPVRLERCIVSNNAATSIGGGVFGSGLQLVDCRIEGNSASNNGGGVWLCCGSLLEACRIAANRAAQGGGAIVGSTAAARNSLFLSNEASSYGGGARLATGAVLENCTLEGNRAAAAGGGLLCDNATARNVICWSNQAPSNANIHALGAATVDHGCTLPAVGAACLTNDPAFADPAAGDYRLTQASPCFDAGTNQAWMAGATDLDGVPRIVQDHVDVGAYEFTPAHHVATNGAHAWPFLNSLDGATNVQAAIDAAAAGDVVYVGPGTYREGGEIVVPTGKNIELRGIAGRDSTVLDGEGVCRVLSASNGAVQIHGFTVRNGYKPSQNGGGLLLGAGSRIWDCLIVSNRANGGGGLQARGILTASNCVFSGNRADLNGGGFFSVDAQLAELADCTFTGNTSSNVGGGAYFEHGSADRCRFSSNVAFNLGGGLYGSGRIANSLFVANQTLKTTGGGGGLWTDYSIVENCTLAQNSAGDGSGGGWVDNRDNVFRNNILYGNQAATGSNYHRVQTNSAYLANCLAPAIGTGCITAPPQFAEAAGDFHLATNSPCLDAGTNQDWMATATDLEGYPRTVDGIVDLGAYERTPVHYVDNKAKGTWPYVVPGTGYRDFAAVLAAAHPDDTLLIAPGTYTQGLEVAVGQRVTLRGTNGWATTIISGEDSHRCFNLATGAVLDNLTLTRGYGTHGGGAYVAGGGRLQDCYVVSNRAGSYGGGVFLQSSGVIVRCRFERNTAQTNDGGGIYLAQGGFVDACRIVSNVARKAGGLFFDAGGRAQNCLVTHNQAVGGTENAQGGGLLFWQAGGRADHCTATGNSSADRGGGAYCNKGGTMVDTIIWDNSAPNGPNNWNASSGTWSYCCTAPAMGDHAITNDPLLQADGRIASNSPCLDAATELISRDMEGQWRPLDGDDSGLAVSDVGAFEILNIFADSDWDQMPDGWEQEHFGSPFGCARPLDDDDRDGRINREEAIADTDPGAADSLFRIESVANREGGADVRFPSSSNRLYTLDYTAYPQEDEAWKPMEPENEKGTGGTMSLVNPSPTEYQWYRVRVRVP